MASVAEARSGVCLSSAFTDVRGSVMHARLALVPDLPGFSDSGKPERVLDVAGLAQALGDGMVALGLAPAALLGNSFGCRVVGELAARRPAGVACAVLQGPTTTPKERGWLIQFVRWRPNAPFDPPELTSLSYEDYAKAGYLRTLWTLHYALKPHLEDRLPAIRAPVFVGRGQRDPICHEAWAERVADGPPEGRLVLVPNVAHTLCHTAPDELAAVASALIEETSPLPPLRSRHV